MSCPALVSKTATEGQHGEWATCLSLLRAVRFRASPLDRQAALGLHMEGEEPECGGGGSHDPHQRMHVSHFVSLGRASRVPYCISYACNPV